MSIPEGATHKMNGSFYKGLAQSGGDLRLERIKVQVWDGVQWHEVYLNDDAPLVEIGVEPYVPEVGGYCEILDGNWHKAFFVGCDEDGYYVFRFGGSLTCLSQKDAKLRPIKTERDILIDIILSAGAMSEGVLADAILGAGFKGPDDE